MKKLIAILLISWCSAFATHTCTTCYVSAAGSDSNSGTSTSLAWVHAPGMPNATGNAASQVPVAGDSYIFRGGDTWHFEAATTPATGGTWAWAWSGSNGNPIYIGVDKTWYTGASWVRPIMNMDNPTSTSLVSSCSYNQGGSVNFAGISFGSNNYYTLDNFEFTGMCVGTASTTIGADYIRYTGTAGILMENNYIHGWTEVNCSGCDSVFAFYGLTSATATTNIKQYNVIDGSDSYCASASSCSGWAVYGDSNIFRYNVVRYIANGLNSPSNISAIHDNLFEQVNESYDAVVHSAAIESNLNVVGQPVYIYNNIFKNIGAGSGNAWPETLQANIYVFNNVSYGSGNSGDCYMVDGQGTSGTPINYYFYNNTTDYPCRVRFVGVHSGQEFNGTGYFENNHIIGYSPAALSSLYSVDSGAAGTTTIVDNGSEVFQSESAANGQGYVSGNNYSPTSLSGATVGAGVNLTTSCSTFSADSALCSGTSAGVAELAGSGGYVASYPAIVVNARPSSGVWDAGAYEYPAGGYPGSIMTPNTIRTANTVVQ